jgi:hypothetical protein
VATTAIWRPPTRPLFTRRFRTWGYPPPPSNESLPIRGMFYYPWFTGGNPSFPGAWDQLGVAPYTQYHPALGYYDSNLDATIDNHVAAMAWGNNKAIIWSWWGPNSREDQVLDNFLARLVALGSTQKVAIYYEAEGNTIAGTPGSPDPAAAQIAADLDYISLNFANHPNYLWVASKPVVFAYGGPEDGTQGASERPTKRWADALLLTKQSWYNVLKVYAGYAGEPDQPSNWHQYGPATAYDQQGTHSVTVSPRYWFATTTTPLWDGDIHEFAANVTSMLAASVDFKLVTSFNEWGEGHGVEFVDGPSGRQYTGTGWPSSSGFGQYLDVLHNNGAMPDVMQKDRRPQLMRQWLAT